MNIDKITLYYNKAMDILFIKQPVRTSLGVIFGIFLDFLVNLFFPYFEKISIISIQRIRLWHLVATGITFLHLPSFFQYIYRKPIGTEKIDEVIQLIEAGNFSEIEKRQKYRQLIEKVLEKALDDEQFRQLVQARQGLTTQEHPPNVN